MFIAQITDTHITIPGSRMDRNYDTAGHLAAAVRHLNALDPQPDLVLATGDLVDAGKPAEYARLRELVAPLSAPLYLLVGNHDDRAALVSAFADHAYLPAPGEPIRYVIEGHAVRVIALDTLIPGESGGCLDEAQLDWLGARLAERPGQPTLIAMHHPPFRTGMDKMDTPPLQGMEGFRDLIARFDTVERIVCGHIHRPISRRFGGTIASVSPSTAHQLALELNGGMRLSTIMEPPACSLYAWLGPADGLVAHTSYIGERFQPFVIFDGERWEDGATPPWLAAATSD